LTFTTLVIANLGLIFTNRSWSKTVVSTLRNKNNALWIVTAGTILFLGLILLVPFLQSLFMFSQINSMDVLICIIAGALSVVWFEILKLVTQQRRKRQTVVP